jgi:hypothetical protein
MKSLLLILFIPFSNTPISYRQLTWYDFKGVPQPGSTIARSYTGIVIEKDTAYAIFESDKSWTRTNDVATLRHEQVHFAITRLYAEFISDELKGKKKPNIDDLLERWGIAEDNYDKDTDHGRNDAEQKKWEEMIKL